jgi:chromosome segregation ATPase
MKTAACPIALVAAAVLLTGISQAEEQDEFSRMRDALRTTMIQLRDVNNRVALLEAEKAAEKAAADKKIASLDDQVKTLTMRSIRDKEAADEMKAAADKAIAALQQQVAEQEKMLAQAQSDLAAAIKANEAAASELEKKEQDKVEAQSKAVVLQRRVDDAYRTNSELYRIGREILARYEKFSLGDAVTAREKFIGITRTKFENLMQDYQDQLDDHRLATP